ncbi:MAG: hypothetical protein HGA23_10705, partial [Bacteroidales bacterium]|nr:hypothetical protein [Bacteroidales bacterium]
VSLNQRDAFDNKNIIAFRHELQVYIDFYDALIIASMDYLDGLENLNAKYAYLIQSVNNYKTELYTELDIKESNLLMTLSNLLPDPALKGIDYNSIIYDPKIRKSLQLAGKYPVLHLAVSDFKKEYNTLLYNFLSNYIKTLKTAKNFPDCDIDKAKTESLISDIEIFISTQKSKEREELDAFL